MKQTKSDRRPSSNKRKKHVDHWFQSTLDSINDAIVSVDEQHKVLHMNCAAEKLTGWTGTEAAGTDIHKIFRIIHTDTKNPDEHFVETVFRNNAVIGDTTTVVLLTKDGNEIPITVRGTPVKGKEDNTEGVVLVIREQTTEHDTGKKFRESERRLKTLLSHLPGMSYRCMNDRNWTMEFVSEGCMAVTGYDPEELIVNNHLSYRQIIHPEYRDIVWETCQTAIQSKKSFKIEYKIITKTGDTKWVREQGEGIFSDQDTFIAVEGCIIDINDQKLAEQALVESKQMIESILNTIPVPVFWKDYKGFFLGCNKPFAFDAGLSSPSELIGKDDYEMGWLEQADLYRQDDQQVIQTGIPKIGYEEPQTSADGTRRILRTSKVPLRNSKGEIIGILGTYEDITKIKESEESLRRSELLFRTVWEKTLDGMRLTDENGIVVKVNDAFCNMMDIAREDIEGKPLSVLYPEERSDHILQRHRQRFRTQTVDAHIEKEVILRNKKKIWFEVSHSFFMHHSQKPLLLGVFRDITGRINADKALRESEEKFRSLFEESKDTVYISTPGGALLDINPAGLEVFGYESKEKMQHINIAEDLYWNPKDRGKKIHELHRNGFIKDYEIELKHKNGTRIIALETATLVRDETGNPVAYRGILRDITRQCAFEEQLRNIHKMESIGTLAGGIAHDFNNILGIIVGYASLMEMNISSPDKLTSSIDAILKASDRGASLVQNLLTFARKTDVVYESMNVHNVINELTQLLEQTLPKKIRIKTTLKANLPPIFADVTQIHQVLLNLALNARDAMPEGGTMSITTGVTPVEHIRPRLIKETAAEYIVIKFSDTGIGMDESTIQRIFDPFFTTKDPGKGSGLGLALVYSIVESNEGIIEVESKPGAGTTFTIYLPVRMSTSQGYGGISIDANNMREGREKILIIEDEELLLHSLKTILIDRGYLVLTASDGEKGLELYSYYLNDLFGNKIDLVISDLGLPKLSGDEVARRIKRLDPRANIILASGFIDPDIKADLRRDGIVEFIQKPYLPDDVHRMIRKVLEKK
jgi:PAS domain S-box-containing protein